MNEQDGATRPRPRIVETSGPEFLGTGRVIRRRQNERVQRETQQPLEVKPLERCKQNIELSAMEGIHALTQLAERMRRSGPLRPVLQRIMIDAESEASRLRTLIDQVYEDD
jgi:hypothetical protein